MQTASPPPTPTSVGTIQRILSRLPLHSMRQRLLPGFAVVLALSLLATSFLSSRAGAEAPADGPFMTTWERTDKPVADQQVSRTWMWGPEAFTEPMRELYTEGHDNSREVQYFDKSRMEITTDESVPFDSPWFVTNGLLVVELMSGNMQTGDNDFEEYFPADIPVAGDPDDENSLTYASFANLRFANPHTVGSTITATLNGNGSIGNDPDFADENVTAAYYVDVTDHTVASIFWEFMNSNGLIWDGDSYEAGALFLNPFYATGYPITDAYWTTVDLAGTPTDVLLQCFERRCLTYTPDNDLGWQVEAGNVGRHYHTWRYDLIPDSLNTPTATATIPVQPSMTSTPTNTPTSTPTTIPSNIATTGNVQIDAVTGYINEQSYDDSQAILRNWQQSGDINLEGWTMRDQVGGAVYTFPEVVIKAGFYVTIQNCDGEDQIFHNRATLYWGQCVDFPLGNALLYDSTGKLIDVWYKK